MPEETEPSCLDERQQLWWGVGSESYISIGNMSCIGNPYDRPTSEAEVVNGGDPVFESSGQGPCFRAVEEDRMNVYSV